jgi:hypothetical protein
MGAMLVFSGLLNAGELKQVAGVIHVHTRFDGSGKHTLQELALEAKKKGLEVLIPTDHDLQAMEFGLFPFRNLIKKRKERPSVLKTGPEKYLSEIARINRKQTEVLVIPGVQSSPFYYWTGSPFKKNLTAHNYRKELLIIGMPSPKDYKQLPLLHRGFSTRYLMHRMPRIVFLLIPLVLGVYLCFQRGFLKTAGVTIAVISLLMIINHHPLPSSKFDPYNGDQGTPPFQEVIDYAREHKGLVFWAHPESNYASQGVTLGPIKLVTEPYPDELIKSSNYTGFSAIYGDTITATKPGMHWDQILDDYCTGMRLKPAWGIAGADFHEESNGMALDTYQTIFMVKEKTTRDILEALSRGRIYAVRKDKKPRLSLDSFQVKNNQGMVGIMGDELLVDGPITVSVKLSLMDGKTTHIQVRLIRSGRIVKTFEGDTPLIFKYEDMIHHQQKIYYRIDTRGPTAGDLLSNPIFVSNQPIKEPNR